MENHHFQWENPLSLTIFNSYVKLPEGKPTGAHKLQRVNHFFHPNLGWFWILQPRLGAGTPVITAAHREVQGLLLLQRQGRMIRVGAMKSANHSA